MRGVIPSELPDGVTPYIVREQKGNPMSWMVYSLGNRYSWYGPVDLYIHVETMLSSYNYRLKHIENYGGMFFDYFRTPGEYVEELLEAIETALDDEFLDREIEGELIVLKRVFKGGRVIMG